MQLALTKPLDSSLYDLVPHGLYEQAAPGMAVRACDLRKAMNPNYLERPSFVTRAASFFIAWIVMHPDTGIRALYTFVAFILQHAPDGAVRTQVKRLEQHVGEVKSRIDSVQDAVNAMPQIRLTCRELVKTRKARKSPAKRKKK